MPDLSSIDASETNLFRIVNVLRQVVVRVIDHPTLRSYTVATVPSASVIGQLIYVSNETGGAVVAFSDGTNWRRVTDRAVVS